MSDYVEPSWSWTSEPEVMAAEMFERRNPADRVWLQRLRIELGKEDHRHRCETRDEDALRVVRDRIRYLQLVNQEIDLLETAESAAEEIRRRHEYEEMREIEARDLERRREQEVAAVERQRIEQSIEHRRASRHDAIAKRVSLDLAKAVAGRGKASETEAMFACAAAYAMHALAEVEDLEERMARLENKSVS